jgi:hypothetical protein
MIAVGDHVFSVFIEASCARLRGPTKGAKGGPDPHDSLIQVRVRGKG